MEKREKLSSRLGFILLSAGCAIGLGNVWRFPYIVGQNGGALFVIIYMVFLVILGVPIMTCEFAVGRASQRSVATSFHKLEPNGSKWHVFSWFAMAGNYLLMMFYTTISGWIFYYLFYMVKGDFNGLSTTQIATFFTDHTSSAGKCVMGVIIACVIGMGICGIGLQSGVEKITKIMMSCLILVMIALVIRSISLPGASEGLKFYLSPNLNTIKEHGLWTVVFNAMGQAFFTLSIGIGSMAIFGSYIDKKHRLMGESINVLILDTFVAITAGLIIFPACFAYNVNPSEGPGLVFVTLPNIFNAMPLSRLWGSLFFLFMSFAALSTLIAVFENIISCGMDKFGWGRKKAVVINIFLVTLLSLPCALGFNLWSGFKTPIGGILDLEDFIVSNNLLPIGSLVYLLFCVSKKGWGYKNFIAEVNSGKGLAFPEKIKVYLKYILPIIVIVIFISGYVSKLIAI